MGFIDADIQALTKHLRKIEAQTTPLWGEMSAIRMIEHLSDSIQLGISEHNYKLTIPEDKTAKTQHFLMSEHPLPKNFKVDFASPEIKIRNNSLDDAIAELNAAWKDFLNYFEENPDAKTLHPSFGHLDFELWKKLHSKHFTHHLQQFGVDV